MTPLSLCDCRGKKQKSPLSRLYSYNQIGGKGANYYTNDTRVVALYIVSFSLLVSCIYYTITLRHPKMPTCWFTGKDKTYMWPTF